MAFSNGQVYANSYPFISVLLIVLELAILTVTLGMENQDNILPPP